MDKEFALGETMSIQPLDLEPFMVDGVPVKVIVQVIADLFPVCPGLDVHGEDDDLSTIDDANLLHHFGQEGAVIDQILGHADALFVHTDD